jgi:hypothetical protein
VGEKRQERSRAGRPPYTLLLEMSYLGKGKKEKRKDE